MNTTKPVPTIKEQTCNSFAAAADALLMRRADRIRESDIEDFVALGWMDWYGGSLRLTALGQMALLRIHTRLTEAVA